MLKTLYEELGKAPAPAAKAARQRAAGWRRRAAPARRGRSRDNPVDGDVPRRARGSTSRAPRRKPGTSSSISRARARLRGRRLLRHLPDERSGAGRCGHRGARRAGGFPDRRAHAARRADRRRVARRPRPTCCSSSSPTSPAASAGRRRRRSPPAKTRTAMPRRSTCWPRWRNSPACGPIRKPSSRRSSRCSRGSIRSRRRRRRNPGRVSLTVDTVRYAIGKRDRLGVASTFLAERIAPGDAAQGLRAEGACASACRPIRRRRSS